MLFLSTDGLSRELPVNHSPGDTLGCGYFHVTKYSAASWDFILCKSYCTKCQLANVWNSLYTLTLTKAPILGLGTSNTAVQQLMLT